MMTRLSEAPQAVQSYRVKSKGVKKLVKRLEEPGFPATSATTLARSVDRQLESMRIDVGRI